jgi:hypothetical protein
MKMRADGNEHSRKRGGTSQGGVYERSEEKHGER